MGNTTTTDSRAQRNRASRRGGQLPTRARGSSYKTGLPTERASRRPCPGWIYHTPIKDRLERVTPRPSCRLPIPSNRRSPRSACALRKTRNCLSARTGLSLMHQLAMSAQKRWRRLRGFRQLADVAAGVKFIDGVDERNISRKAA